MSSELRSNFQLNKMGPRDASQSVQIQRNLSEIFNGDGDDEEEEEEYGGKSQFAQEAEIVGQILLGGLLVFGVAIFCCTCPNNRNDNGTVQKYFLPRELFTPISVDELK